MDERCHGIGCDNDAPSPGRDGVAPHGWIELGVDEEQHRFCSWDCLASFANDRRQAAAGD
jgi:hypothetical protein